MTLNIVIYIQTAYIQQETSRETTNFLKKIFNSLSINPTPLEHSNKMAYDGKQNMNGNFIGKYNKENNKNDFNENENERDNVRNENDKPYNYYKYNENNDIKQQRILQQKDIKWEDNNNINNNKNNIKNYNNRETMLIFVKKPQQQDTNKSFRMQLSNLNEPTESAVASTYQNDNNFKYDDGHKRNNVRPRLNNNEIAAKKSTRSYFGRVENYDYNKNNKYNEMYNRYGVYYGNANNNNNNNKKTHNESNNVYYNDNEQLNNGQLLSMSLFNKADVVDVQSPQQHDNLKSSDDILIGVDNNGEAAATLSSNADNCAVEVDNDNDALVPYDLAQIADTTNDENYNDELNMNLLYGIQNAAPRKKRSSSLTSTSYQSLCPTTRTVMPLETELYEYRPQSYVEVKCAHTYMPHFKYDLTKNKICSEAGFYCVQLNRTIQLIRRRKYIKAECWESEMRIVPSGCECMWPKHNYGDIITYHEQPQKRIPSQLKLWKLGTYPPPQESHATKQTRATNDFDWQMYPSKRQLTLNDVQKGQARILTA